MPLQHSAIHRDLGARPDDDDIADLHLINGNFLFLAILYNDRRLGRQAHQLLDGFARAAL